MYLSGWICLSLISFPGDSIVKKKKKKFHLPMQETQVPSLIWEDPLEKGMATYSNILAWEIPWTEEPGRLYSSRGHRHELVTK